MTRHMAMEGRKFGIRANSVSPGVIVSDQTRDQLKTKNVRLYARPARCSVDW